MEDEFRTSVIRPEERLELLAVELSVTHGPDLGKRLHLTQGTARIGTAPTADLCLTDPTVSRLHCEIELGPRGARVVDAGSTNGTHVDGVHVHDAELRTGSTLRVGATTLRVDFGPERLYVELSARDGFGGVLGGSVPMRRMYAVLERVAPTDTTVLVLGETGTGKELVARAIHDASRRAERPFIAVDCGAIAENLIESELFGHVRGAFSGAAGDRAGLFEEASGGTLFFDEIGELPHALQPKLLRVLETREVRRVGSNAVRRVDVRVLAATNRSLLHSVNKGTFRDDLYYRLAVVEVTVPPLRARREDIPVLAAHFIERFEGAPAPVPPALLDEMLFRSWPGNVRELRNFVERSVSLGAARQSTASARDAEPIALPAELDSFVPLGLPLKEARVAWTEQFESVYLRALLRRTGGHISRAAEIAGVNRRFLQRMMSRLGVRSNSEPGSDGSAD